MPRSVLAVNAGSSTVKWALFTLEPSPALLHRDAGTTDDALDRILEQCRDADLAAAGHRVVHGGPYFQAPERITAELVARLDELVAFAPNHLPGAIRLIKDVQRALPEIPQVACFDTAFHHDMPEVARRLPIPKAYNDRGVRKYGFHGLSYAYLVRELHRRAGDAARGRLVLAHLGSGSSLAAVRDGRSVDTSMGFTPLGGVVMSTRSGDLDPGLVTFIGRSDNLSPDRVEELLSHEAGLLAISGRSGDMRQLLERESTDPACRLAVDSYAYHVRKCIGAFAAALGGIDSLVFSGGIGEHAPEVRRRICTGLEWLGVQIDDRANANNNDLISTPVAHVAVRVIPTDEEIMIAQYTFKALEHAS
jgi:acetate kinase